jgi:hypothetical protein
MILAHTIGVGGPDLEMMVLAAALVFLGIILFVQKTAKPAVSVGLMVAALAVGGGRSRSADRARVRMRGSRSHPHRRMPR